MLPHRLFAALILICLLGAQWLALDHRIAHAPAALQSIEATSVVTWGHSSSEAQCKLYDACAASDAAASPLPPVYFIALLATALLFFAAAQVAARHLRATARGPPQRV